MSDRDTPQAGRLLMSLYPARYRAAHGEDIAATFTEATEGLPRRGVLRERRHLAAHAMRLRLRIGPTDPAGRVLAGAAPVALAIAAGRCLVFLLPNLRELVHRIRYPFPNLGLGNAVLSAVFQVADNLPWLLALAFAVTGRWRAARITGALAALIGVGLQVLVAGPHEMWMVGYVVGLALAGALVLLAPPDLVDVAQRGRWEIAGLSLGIGLPMIAAGRYGIPVLGGVHMTVIGLLPIWLCAVTALVLLLRLSGRRPDRLRAAGVALGVLPWLVHLAFATLDDSVHLPTLIRYTEVCLAPLCAAVAAAGVVHLVRRTRVAEPSDPV